MIFAASLTYRRSVLVLGLTLVQSIFAVAQTAPSSAPTTAPFVYHDNKSPIDLSKQKTLYVVGYAHLDTQWRWAYPLVIREYIGNTLRRNFELFEKYPNYVFNFSGSRRYEMMKEYYPKDFEKLQRYIAAGRWFVCGSSVDENDANVPSAESQIRHILYGNHFARREFGTDSREFMLPDCFGFPAALPSVLAHCGIRGFSTQKLTWGSAVGIPFKVGVWEGPDGKGVIAALDPGAYSGKVNEDLSKNDSWLTRINNTGKASGVFADYHYYGTGDRGGAPGADSVEWIERSVAGEGPIHVVSGTAEKMFLDITDEQRAKLPKYQGELLLTEHSAGSITSEGYMKRWNRKNELLADAAERSAVAAQWLGGASYPTKKLYDAWLLVLGSQMHDMLPGTSLPKCYEYCWNDELLALNQFASIERMGASVVAEQMDTRAQGVPLVVYNPLSVERQDVVEATLSTPAHGNAVGVFGPDDKEVPSQVISQDAKGLKILFVAKAPSVGFVTYDVRPSGGPRGESGLKIDNKSLENDRFRVTINAAGDISSVFDKQNKREVLSAPSQLAFLYENPQNYPAWNMDWNDRKNPPRSYVTGPAKVRVVEKGPVRATLEVTREAEGSRFVQRISLSRGVAADRVEIANTIDWQTQERSLKVAFPFAVSNPQATYDIQVGTVQRGNNDPKKYEVPQHQWMDLTDSSGNYGVAILNDCKYGSDKPDDNTLRLTLLYTPGTRGGYRDQGTQDIGRHQIVYAIAPHAGDWREGNVPWMAQRLNQPMMVFQSPEHTGGLGKSFSLLKVSTDQVAVQAIKKAEDSDEIIVRLKELTGKPADDVRISAAGAIESAREVNGQEDRLGDAKIEDGALKTELGPYRLRTFALKLGAPSSPVSPPQIQSVKLPYDIDAVSFDSNRNDGAFDGEGRTYPAEQLPARIFSDGIEYITGPIGESEHNAMSCRGQTIELPARSQRVYLLAAAFDGDQQDQQFVIGDKTVAQTIHDWSGYIGQWDNRIWDREIPETATQVNADMCGLVPGWVKDANVAWFCSHRHHPRNGNEFYQYCYMFSYGFDVPSGTTSLKLPDNPKVRIFAITVAKNAPAALIASRPMYDNLADHAVEPVASISPNGGKFNDVTRVTLRHPLYWQAGGLRYTTDGSEPTADSPVYRAPIVLTSSAKVRARQFNGEHAGPEVSADFDINDITPPTVIRASAVSMLPQINITFSEPLSKSTAEVAENYQLDPPL
ncbi:MAG TPA: glycoside hydrolase family 38 C-terminal domain-containing protein, partial [Tepidisphaeraceae bacterium]